MPREGHDTAGTWTSSGRTLDFNPRAPRGARREKLKGVVDKVSISIHVPREGHDMTDFLLLGYLPSISIHVPREGHDTFMPHPHSSQRLFQSTCPARGTTSHKRRDHAARLHFNPRAPRGARPGKAPLLPCQEQNFNPRAPRGARLIAAQRRNQAALISIHVPREGHDL